MQFILYMKYTNLRPKICFFFLVNSNQILLNQYKFCMNSFGITNNERFDSNSHFLCFLWMDRPISPFTFYPWFYFDSNLHKKRKEDEFLKIFYSIRADHNFFKTAKSPGTILADDGKSAVNGLIYARKTMEDAAKDCITSYGQVRTYFIQYTGCGSLICTP